MLLPEFRATEDCMGVANECFALAQRIFPICRSITGDGVRQTLGVLGEYIPLKPVEVPSGTPVLDWEVPHEWNVRDAYIKGPDGRKVVDFQSNNLHLVSYSRPVSARMALAELRTHLFSLPQHPDWIPYRTSYYRDAWGFCLTHRALESLSEGEYEVVVDTSHEPGSLTYAELVLPGESPQEVLIYTHVCHPSLANDNVSGMSLATMLARHLAPTTHHFTYRFVFAPTTIGSVTWLARNEANVGRIAYGLVMGLTGDRGALTYKASRRGDTAIDAAARHVLPNLDPNARLEPFSPYGYDERNFCSPGFNLAVGRLTRSANGKYPEYHSSADNLDLIEPRSIAETFLACVQILRVLEHNVCFVNLRPKGEPRLGPRGLFRTTGGTDPGRLEHAYLWLLNQSDGGRSLLEIAERAGMPFDFVYQAACDLQKAGLVERAPREGS